MNFNEFKDEAISLIMEDKLKGRILDGTPIYVLGKDTNDHVEAGGLDVFRSNLIEYVKALRRVTSSMKYNYASVSLYSMVADLNSMEEEERERIKQLPGEELMKFLEERNMLKKSISMRFENKLNTDENCMITFMMSPEGVTTNHVEILDGDLTDEQKIGSPFKGGLF